MIFRTEWGAQIFSKLWKGQTVRPQDREDNMDGGEGWDRGQQNQILRKIDSRLIDRQEDRWNIDRQINKRLHYCDQMLEA